MDRLPIRSRTLRGQVLLPLAAVLAVAVLGVGIACTLAARDAAGQRVAERATTAHSLLERRLDGKRAPSRDQISSAVRDVAAQLGVGVSVDAGKGPASAASVSGSTKTFTYALSRPAGSVTVAVPSAPIAKATSTGLTYTLGVGVGVFLVLFPLVASLLDRRLATPLRALVSTIEKALKGDAEARAEVGGPDELARAGTKLNELLDTRSEIAAKIERAESTDYLTGAHNNQRFNETLEVEVKRARRDETSLGLVVLGIDRFESFNDAYGRAKGDLVLQAAANELRNILRATDHLSRLGGDEFALILPGADPQLVLVVAERARQAIAAASPEDRRLTCSAGVASFPDQARDGSSLLQFANGALRWAKREGKNQTRRFDPDHVTIPRGEDELAEIEALLEQETPVVAHFQPLVALSTGRILGFEALARFPAPPQRGPDSWFAQAHRCGFGAKLEAMAIRAALDHPGRPAGTFLSINVSPTIIDHEEIQAVLPEDMTNLVVEITEHELADDIDRVLAELGKLRERGARIAVDDAGSGYSGLQQVMLVHPDVIKLDRSLVQGLDTDPAKVALIDSFVRFARRTGATVCAEGIETMEEMRTLADLDVTYGQGYALARPAATWVQVSANVSEALLRRSLQSQADVTADSDLADSGDKRLEFVSARISQVGSIDDLGPLLELIAAEVGADSILLSRWLEEEDSVETILDGDPSATGERFKLANYPSTKHVLKTQEAVQVLASDPGADIGEVSLLTRAGYSALLMVPVVCRGGTMGLLEAFSGTERPWTRSEINRARIISYQLGSALDGLARADVPAAAANGAAPAAA